jgi:hypothetical protein
VVVAGEGGGERGSSLPSSAELHSRREARGPIKGASDLITMAGSSVLGVVEVFGRVDLEGNLLSKRLGKVVTFTGWGGVKELDPGITYRVMHIYTYVEECDLSKQYPTSFILK